MNNSRSYHHGNLKEELLDAAVKLLDKDGIEAIGIRQVAKVVGVAHSAPANHFKNKRALLLAVNNRVVNHLVTTVQNKMADIEASEEPIQKFSAIVLEYGLKYPNRYRLVWGSEFELDEAMEKIYQILVDLLQDSAVLKNVDVESQAIALWSLIHGYVSLRLDKHLDTGQDDVTGLARQSAIIDVIINGLR